MKNIDINKQIEYIEYEKDGKKFKAEFRDGICILFGGNGLGKTTFLNNIFYSLLNSFSETNCLLSPKKSSLLKDFNSSDHIRIPDKASFKFFNSNDVYGCGHEFDEKKLMDHNSKSNRRHYNPIDLSIDAANKSLLTLTGHQYDGKVIDSLKPFGIIGKTATESLQLFLKKIEARKINHNQFNSSAGDKFKSLFNLSPQMNTVRTNIINIFRSIEMQYKNYGIVFPKKNLIKDRLDHGSVEYLTTHRNRPTSPKGKIVFSDPLVNYNLSHIELADLINRNIGNSINSLNNNKKNMFDLMIENVVNGIQFSGSGDDVDEYLKEIIMLIRPVNEAEKLISKINLDNPVSRSLKSTLLANKSNIITIMKQKEKLDLFIKECNSLLVHKKILIEDSELVTRNIESNITMKFSESKFSAGELNVVNILFTIIMKDNKIDLLIFDEPELSMSIDWQVKLMDFFDRTDKISNLLIVTHSPFLATRENHKSVQRFELND